MRKFVDIMGSARLVRRTAIIIISAIVLFALSSTARAEKDVACEECKSGIALPGEPCIVKPMDEWTDIEKWVWIEICEGYDANLDKRSGNTKFDPKNPNNNDKLLAKRKLSTRFLRTILLHEPFPSAVPHRGVRIMGAYFEDEIDLRDASISQPLALTRSLFKSPVKMDRFTTPKSVDLSRSRFDDKLNMEAAKIGARLDMSGSTFKDELEMDSALIKGDFFMRTRLMREIPLVVDLKKAEFGDVDLRRLQVGGVLDMSGCRIDGALDLSFASIKGDLFMRGNRLELFDWFRLHRASKQSNFSREELLSKLALTEKEKFKANFAGPVNLREVKIGGVLDMSGSSFKKEIDLSFASVKGDLLMRSYRGEAFPLLSLILEFLQISEHRTTLQDVYMSRARIDGDLDVQGAKLGKLDLTSTRIERVFRLGSYNWNKKRKVSEAENKKHGKFIIRALMLRNASIGTIQDTTDAWPEDLELDGFTYKRFESGEKETLCERSRGWPNTNWCITDWFIKWLAKDKSYSPQPYLHLAGVLRDAGFSGVADRILYENREHERKNSTWSEYWLLTLLWLVFGYGYGWRSLLTLFWAGVFVVIGTVILPIRDERYKKEKLGFWYSLDMLLPAIHLREQHYEVDLKTRWIRVYFFIHKIIGFVLTFFLLSGLSGLTKYLTE